MRKPTEKEKLKAAVASGTITAEQYKAITGENYTE
ncbi:XkdX family protein [Caproiciproducens galactitolivorans]|nr:XkdX family protein [Caproiciproducens galactitolivorans]QEY35889.1 XkdX family protein [Caproiciproducens galactitolivorans]